MLDVVLVLGLLICLAVVLVVLEIQPQQQDMVEQQRLDAMSNAMRVSREMQHDAWVTAQRMTQLADSAIDVDDTEGR
jgi:hypothetical protein